MDIIIPENFKQYYDNSERVVKYPDPMLKRMCEEVEDFDLNKLAPVYKAMKQILIETRGIGLAGPQIGIPRRILTLAASQEYKGKNTMYLFMANPEIISEKDGQISTVEGCLSLPGASAEVARKIGGKVKYRDLYGKEKEISLHGQQYIAFQHELDHLNGILFIDKADPASLAWSRPGYRVI
jgi:peptide deformylase